MRENFVVWKEGGYAGRSSSTTFCILNIKIYI